MSTSKREATFVRSDTEGAPSEASDGIRSDGAQSDTELQTSVPEVTPPSHSSGVANPTKQVRTKKTPPWRDTGGRFISASSSKKTGNPKKEKVDEPTKMEDFMKKILSRMDALEKKSDDKTGEESDERRVRFQDDQASLEAENQKTLLQALVTQVESLGYKVDSQARVRNQEKKSADSVDNPLWSNRGGVYARDIGDKANGLKELVPTDVNFIPLMNYRRYRLQDATQSLPNAKGISKVRDNLASSLPIKYSFDGTEPVMVFNFLGTLADKADTLSLNERVLYVVLPNFLKGPARIAFDSAVSAGSSSSRPVGCWPSAVNFFLRRYGTDENIKAALDKIQNLKQLDHEDEETFFTRFEQAIVHAGAPLDHRDKITRLIHGFDETYRHYLFRYFRENPDCTILDILEFAKVEGQTNRARSGRKKTSRAVAAIHGIENEDDRTGYDVSDSSGEDGEDERCHEQFAAMTAAKPTTGDIFADYHHESAEVFAFGRQEVVPSKSYRNPGWVNPPRRPGRVRRFTRLVDVCENCYERGSNRQLPHDPSKCGMVLPQDAPKLITNFNRLALWEVGKVHLNMYLRAIGAINEGTFSGTGLLATVLNRGGIATRPSTKPTASVPAQYHATQDVTEPIVDPPLLPPTGDVKIASRQTKK